MSGKQQTKVSARKLKGFQDYGPEVMALRYSIMDAVREEGRRAGFQAIGTPVLEYADVLLGVGGETDKQVFRFVDNGERDVAMRFDLTVPFARYVAEHHGTMHFPFKRLQIGDVWRAEKPQKGRYREFCQCDLDIIGVNSLEADVEILVGFHNILRRVAPGPYTMALGNRNVLSAVIRKALPGLPNELETEALIIIDKWAKIGPDEVCRMLSALSGATPAGAAQLVAVLTRQAGEDSDLKAIATLLADDQVALAELRKLEATLTLVRELHGERSAGSPARTIVDLGIARGLGYYTGVVFETTLDELPGFGSICSGGRYNYLVERYLNRELPGIGGSVGLDRLVAGIAELGRLPQGASQQTVFVALATEDACGYGFKIAQMLRTAGLSCDIALKTHKLAQQFKHADRMGYPFVITVGSDEMATGSVRLKDMRDGQEESGIKLADLSGRLQERLPSA